MSSPKRQDETLFCERCGISFLWSMEEQKQAIGQDSSGNGALKQLAPTHCPGCRQLLPAPDRERGLVKWYNAQKRYGFITRRSSEIYMHGSELQGQRRLEPGDLVEFSIGANERGPAAVAVQLLERASDL